VGTWGTGPFDNDDAADWVYELEAAPDAEVVRTALRRVTLASEYLDAPDASIGLAAAEVVAADRDGPAPKLPDSVVAWVQAHRESFDAADRAAALAVVDRVLGADSELNELWLETGDRAWIDRVHDLRRRLGAS